MNWVSPTREIELPEPDTFLGYSRSQLRTIFTEEEMAELSKFMHRQTMAMTPEGEAVIFPSDIHRFIEGLPIID